ncbi:glycerophosphodiester phosphodiesterase [Nostoc sp. FACHB-110]|uniref:glycerophosphodiester phosphodiesterase n=1 Tax=Nostoc sp. FACHB-110 TaxID=2692834 RepID=UPI0016826625|nr:glycerophosphodiester phosphodiesterase [Nostoc sp. FACHB-110]MBD2435935.1 glycerophosphodiester phosphodiesterase [Nostoc sp. FACHB-110]
MNTKIPIVIAHRGASGYLPEHTLAAYELAINLGADYIEPDLVATKDGVLIARHENEISQTTDVAHHREFAHLHTTKIIDGETKTGWFTEDFTLAEIKTLKATERIPQIRLANTKYNGLWEIPTLQEIIDLAKHKTATLGRKIGIYPETKHPSYFQSIGLPLEDNLLTTLITNDYQGANASVFIQSFEVANLQYLAQKTNLPLVQLINLTGQPYDVILRGESQTYADLITTSGLESIAEYAQAIGIHKDILVPKDSTGKLQAATNLVQDAHAVGLQVHIWTFRNEDCFLPLDFLGDPEKEAELFFNLGVDGVFSDFADLAVAVRDRLSQNNVNH